MILNFIMGHEDIKKTDRRLLPLQESEAHDQLARWRQMSHI